MNACLGRRLLNAQCQLVEVVLKHIGDRPFQVGGDAVERRQHGRTVYIAQERPLGRFPKCELEEEALERVVEALLLVARLGER